MSVRQAVSIVVTAVSVAGVSAPAASAFQPVAAGGSALPLTSVAYRMARSHVGQQYVEPSAVPRAWQEFADRRVADRPQTGPDSR
jgi:hypothetical protein